MHEGAWVRIVEFVIVAFLAAPAVAWALAWTAARVIARADGGPLRYWIFAGYVGLFLVLVGFGLLLGELLG